MSTDPIAARIMTRLASESIGRTDVVEAEPPSECATLLRRWTMPELLAEPSEFEWLISGLLANPTYGQVAGEMKTLKSYLTGFIEVGLASGVPIFGRFAPQGPKPVVAYVGEGGRMLWVRRICRICSAMGVTPSDLDLHPIFDVAAVPSRAFQDSLRRDLEDVQPALLTMDPFYTYHGMATKASDLHQEGALLNQLSKPCMDAGASLLVVNHMNQTGYGRSLKRITMAGSGEWADSWLLLEHRDKPDVPAGSFKLTLEVGSRQWGGSTWNLDLEIGRFNEESGTHDGEISWKLERSTGSGAKQELRDDRGAGTRETLLEKLAASPWSLGLDPVRRIGCLC